MVESTHLLAMSLVALVIIAVPGPGVLFVISRVVSLGRKAALATVVGNEVGLLVQVVAVAFGVGALVAYSVAVFTAIKLVGAGYLVYLGVRTPAAPRSGGGTQRYRWPHPDTPDPG